MEGFLDINEVMAKLDIREGMSVADFGCGSGHFTLLIAKKVGEQGKVVALDVQEAPLEAVQARAKAEGLGNIEIIRANLEVLGSSKLNDASQDAVLVANILFQSQKKKEIISEAQRILKSGGQLILIEWKKGSGGVGLPDSYRMSEEEVVALLTSSGFAMEKEFPAGKFHHGFIFKKS